MLWDFSRDDGRYSPLLGVGLARDAAVCTGGAVQGLPWVIASIVGLGDVPRPMYPGSSDQTTAIDKVSIPNSIKPFHQAAYAGLPVYRPMYMYRRNSGYNIPGYFSSSTASASGTKRGWIATEELPFQAEHPVIILLIVDRQCRRARTPLEFHLQL